LYLQNPVDGGFYGLVNSNTDSGNSNYNGLLFSIQRRAGSGVNVGANYTWSHCIGPDTTFSHNSGGGYLDPTNRAFDKGNCNSDRRHVFNMTATAQTPQFANPTMRIVATGWRLSGIYRRSAGSPLTINTGLDRALTGEAGVQRAMQILEEPYGERSSLDYLNPNAFAQPAPGTISNMSPNNMQGPGTWQFDMALSRTFPFREDQRLEFRGEAFNVTNSLIRENPNTTLNSNTFGQINSSRDARVMQFVLKYVF
jgi:hypothetical protein